MKAEAPMRMQVACNGVLVAEVIVEGADVDAFRKGGDVWTRFARAKHAAGKPIGGAVLQRADLPRVFDVSVGSEVNRV